MPTTETRREQTRKAAHEQGRDAGRREMLLEQLAARFGPVPSALTARITSATRPQLIIWAKRLLTATSPAEVFTTNSAKPSPAADPTAPRSRDEARRTRESTLIHLHILRLLVRRPSGATIPEMEERLRVERRSVQRLLAMLGGELGEPLFADVSGRVKTWRSLEKAQGLIEITTLEMSALLIARERMTDFVGLGLDAALESVIEKLLPVMKDKEYREAKTYARKFFHVPTGAQLYTEADRDNLDELGEGLIREEIVDITNRDGKAFAVHPLSIFDYKQSIYVVAWSGQRGQIRTFGLDYFKSATWRKKEKFVYPEGYDPEAIRKGFGIIKGTPTEVCVLFDKEAARFAARRLWNDGQSFEPRADAGRVMRVTVSGTTELASRLLEYGDKAEVLSPPAFRAEIAATLRRAVARYEGT